MRAADALIAALVAEGVDVAFGLPGGASLPLHDALHDCSALRHVLVRHEAAAGHAAEGYARASGRVGVALVTSGPGATNLVTPLANAAMDSTPLVAITGQVRTDLRGTDAFQETDVIGMTAPVVKHAIAVERARDVVPAVREAFAIARGGRPGPVVVDVPTDVAREIVPRGAAEAAGAGRGVGAAVDVDREAVRAAARAIAGASRPVLYVGGGVVHAGAAAELMALADAGGLPVTTTLMALGAFPASDDRWLGMLGMHGCRTANWAVDECDVLVAVGARFDDRVTGRIDQFAPAARTVVHLDVDPSEVGKLVRADVALVGDARASLAALASALRELTPGPERVSEWWRVLRAWRDAEAPPAVAQDGSATPPQALDALQRVTGGEAIVTTDVGNHQMWAAKRLRFDAPRRWITSGGLGTMGFGLPAAIGAQIAAPHRAVVCVTGDGSFLMNMQEMVTTRAEGLPVKVLLINDGHLGMVRQQQDQFWGGRRQDVDLGVAPAWSALAEACGWSAARVGDADAVDDAVAWLVGCDGPALLDVAVAPDADCLPMFPPGAAARDMIG